MKKYTVDVIIDGWARLEVQAPSREAVYKLINEGNFEIRFKDDTLEAELKDSEFFIDIEEVESFKKSRSLPYHDPQGVPGPGPISKNLTGDERASYYDYFYSEDS